MKPSASIISSRRCSRQPSGFAWCRIPTADGAKPAAATTIPTPAASVPALRRRPHGLCSDLLSAGDDRSDSIAKGVRWLLTRQTPGGGWDESVGAGITRQAIYTGTGFPRVFYLAYHMYRNYFPLLALTGYKRAMERAS